ncbi:UNVERIFIED_CONTAM: putative aminoacrylate hydrolase RutD, partial [Sesamum radiatum]
MNLMYPKPTPDSLQLPKVFVPSCAQIIVPFSKCICKLYMVPLNRFSGRRGLRSFAVDSSLGVARKHPESDVSFGVLGPNNCQRTRIMAKDAIALMDHLGWEKAHVFGHSMGAMIACKLAAMVPERILSLALLNVTGGGYECIPKIDRQTLSIAMHFLRAKTPEQRAAVDLDTHYSQEYLEEYVGQKTRRSILYQEYVKGISATGMQSNYGFDGQVNACWTQNVTSRARVYPSGWISYISNSWQVTLAPQSF